MTWYVYTPHDGRRIANSDAQKAILEAGLASGAGSNSQVDEHERARMALQVWNDEKGFSTTVLVLGWLIKVCLITDLTIPLLKDSAYLTLSLYRRSTSLQSYIPTPFISEEVLSVPS